jgi:transcriptional regulator GlxA family with amidase domain
MRKIAFLVFDDFQLLDAAGPIAAFEIAARQTSSIAYELVTVSLEGGGVRSSSGVTVDTRPFGDTPTPDTLVVAGGQGTYGPATTPAILDYVGEVPARRVASVCSGAAILAAAGLLDGRRATTHWRQVDRLQRLFPAVRVEPDRIWIRDGHVWTSAGITAGIDLALALIADDLGEAIAQRTAQELVVPRRRSGGQSQHAAPHDLAPPSSRFAHLLDWARQRLHEPLPVERLADRAGMSPRHFARAFRTELGSTPAKAVERLRLEAARAAVEDGSDTLDRVAATYGFGDPERMRRAFIRTYGQPAQALRRSASQAREASRV